MSSIPNPRILVACELSGKVREALAAAIPGAHVVSVDLLPTTAPCSANSTHVQADVSEYMKLNPHWDAVFAFPPCTHLCVSGARWFKDKLVEQVDAISFAKLFLDHPAKIVVVENPVGVLSTKVRKATQYIQPWEHGHGETKKTGLWLKGVPPLVPSMIVTGREARVHRMAPSPDRARLRSETYQGVADAMAQQWAPYITGDKHV